MATDFSIKPVGAPVATPILRPVPDAVRAAVPTQLPPDKSVTAAEPLLRANISASNYQQVDSDRISREVLVDRDAAEVVYVSVDKKTNQVINQFPEESRLRARAYLRAQDTAKLEVRKIETDRRA
ncbi:hypothetical protein [Tardiphaga sp.]|jgi:hypothetical protein|uniref:hypothetical protein n=1 Tax=Tardiphaga sp. TaxID=1926292 RepID=UPI0019CBB682|nr:hypothetical protein [Tardiphaga sp.]MBC7580242.1 hypothetical protein [Tardiphaga sp.]